MEALCARLSVVPAHGHWQEFSQGNANCGNWKGCNGAEDEEEGWERTNWGKQGRIFLT